MMQILLRKLTKKYVNADIMFAGQRATVVYDGAVDAVRLHYRSESRP